jgi:SagB-type dehydrogenase family enzyme
VLRHALGLSAWKQVAVPRSSTLGALRDLPGPARETTASEQRGIVERRWSLRVNPSSGNLHPTEAYVICGPLPGLARTASVYHYAADRHALEQRCAFDDQAWTKAAGENAAVWLVALTSIHWREAWKYGERAFRYCQHDLGHAIAALRIAAGLCGWRARMRPDWAHRDIAALTGIDRDQDFFEAEREAPGCLLALEPSTAEDGQDDGSRTPGREALLEGVRAGRWSGRASQLSEDHVEWTFIDEVARATDDPGRAIDPPILSSHHAIQRFDRPGTGRSGRQLVLQRRSAVAFDGRSTIGVNAFLTMLEAAMPDAGSPWDAIWWDARVHLALFVHRVDGLDPGLYALVRNPRALGALSAAMTRDFAWERVTDRLPLFLLARGDGRRMAQRVSCDQDIASDGFFSLGMLAEFDASLREFGPAFYRHLFWESGVVGQVLYLEAEAAGARATGIGCFYDDPVHDVFGLSDHAFQSLYHFTIGMPVDDPRLTTEPGYVWG